MNVKRKCPECSHKRHNKADKPLSYDTERRIFKCHHCGWSGCDKDADYITPRKVYKRPEYEPTAQAIPDKLAEFFKGRGISAEVIARNKIEVREAYFSQTGQSERCIAFPYFRDGEIVNVKYRTKDKQFRMESDCELTLYGIDDVKPGEPLVWVEGEFDKLALESVGITAVSVPNGAGTNLDILAAAESKFSLASHHVMAADSDKAGMMLQAELIRRLGPERCYRTTWPDGCKDANEVLVAHGDEVLRDCLAASEPIPIEGVFELDDVRDAIIDLYENGRPPGEDCGWESITELYRPTLGTWTVVTGSPSSGKSSFMRAYVVNIAMKSRWRFLVFPPEDCPAEEYYSLLAEIHAGYPFQDQPRSPKMTRDMLDYSLDWVKQFFYVLHPADGKRDMDSMLETTDRMILRRGINSVMFDPFNRMEHFQTAGMTQQQYIQKTLSRFDYFVKLRHLHGVIVSHPTKLKKEADGSYPVATLYDISGAADWFNMCDFGLSVWRDKGDPNSPVEVHVQKVRKRWLGKTGMASLYWDSVTGRFGERPFIWDLPKEQEYA